MKAERIIIGEHYRIRVSDDSKAILDVMVIDGDVCYDTFKVALYGGENKPDYLFSEEFQDWIKPLEESKESREIHPAFWQGEVWM